ncbi:TRIM25 [Mytilus coruscus]|uniref:TRIM25 n=1 Tax=Mytilus coruscus TaxID=42192 RepID=A0A6J8EEL8_MYTCO|nr:TRIM25 [Mytilus coruscus]
MTDVIKCDPSAYEDNIKHAKKWCTTCEEGFCADCEKVHRSTKMSRNHTLITFSDYRKMKNVSVSQTCVGHGKRYDLYCPQHDIALCIDCVDQHKTCSKLLSLDKAAKNAKQSTALADLEDKIDGTLQNVVKFIKDEKLNAEQFETQEKDIKKNINETRENINTHLDFLEKQITINLTEKTSTCKATYCSNLSQWRFVDQKLKQLKEKIETMKQMASDEQVFLGTRELNNMVSAEIKFIKSTITNAKHFGINMAIDPTITFLLNCTNQFGVLSVIERKSEL